MKKTIFLLVLLTGILSQSNTYASSRNKQVRDSIFAAANTLKEDSMRCQYLRNAFQQYIGQETATEYLDSALALSIRHNLPEEELWALFEYCRQYEYRSELSNLDKQFQRLKEASYRHKNYLYYYSIWLAVLQAKCSQGDTEYAILQAQQMKEEATRAKYDNGLFIASLALAQAYAAAGQEGLAIATYKQTLKESPKANDASKEMIHAALADIYLKQKSYAQALQELKKQEVALKRITQIAPESDTYKASWLALEISFCKIYMAQENQEQLSLHLQKAQGYYHEHIYKGTYIDYHALWGAYYKLTQEWDKSFQAFKLALAACEGLDPFHENQILAMYANALMKAEHYEEAAITYKQVAARGDSLNRDMLQRHQEAHQANYKIRTALLEQEQQTRRNLYIQVGAATFVLILLIIAIIRAAHIRKQLLRSEKETREAFETMKAADKMKDRFLHNITHEIRIPLNTVVGFSELLSSEGALPEEELEEYSTAVKSNAGQLLSLINNILDLSRLEAGMMRFDVQENDIVQLCGEAEMTANRQEPQTVEATFTTDLETLPLKVDSRWFLKVLMSLLSTPDTHKGEKLKVAFTLSRTYTELTVTVTGSPLYHCWENEQEQHILHDINRLYVEAFKGSYLITRKGESKLVSICFPLE